MYNFLGKSFEQLIDSTDQTDTISTTYRVITFEGANILDIGGYSDKSSVMVQYDMAGKLDKPLLIVERVPLNSKPNFANIKAFVSQLDNTAYVGEARVVTDQMCYDIYIISKYLIEAANACNKN